jgi:energy-converting hydrogenase Eha subunit H
MNLTKSDWSAISATLYGFVGMFAMLALGNIIIVLNTLNVLLCFVAIYICLALGSMAKEKSLVEAEWESEDEG